MVFVSPLMSTLLLAALTVDAAPLAGDVVRGELVGLSSAVAQVKTDEGVKPFPLKTLKRLDVVDAKASVPEGAIPVELIGGAQLLATEFSVTDSKANLKLTGQDVSGDSNRLRTVLFRDLANEAMLANDWAALVERPLEGDCLAFTRERDDTLILEHLEGAIGNLDGEVVNFSYQGDTLKPKRSKVLGLIYLPVNRSLADAVGIVKLVDGSSIPAASLKWVGDALEVTSRSGWEFVLPSTSLQAFEFGSSNTVYLSDLKPTGVECEPYFGVVLESERQGHLPRTDEDHRGQPLKLPGQDPAAKGIAVRSQTKMVYRFDKPYKRLVGVAGIAEYAQFGDVTPHLVLKISSDRKTLFEQPISGEDKPVDIDLDLSGVQRLTIEVQYGKSQDIGDFLHLCNVRLTK